MNKQEFGLRVKQARKLAGLSQQELADKIHVEKMTVSKYETGKTYPTSTHLLALSGALGVSPEYFFRRIHIELTAEPLCRMEKSAQKLNAKDKTRIISQTQDFLEKRADIFDIMQIAGEEPKALRLRRSINPAQFHAEIEKLAEEVRTEWKLGSDPVENLMSVAENNGFTICLVDGPEQFEAAVFHDENAGTVICLKKGAPKERQRFSLAHELGHCFIIPGERPEAEANNFAAALLIPRDSLIADTGSKRKNIEISELLILREKYGVSVPALLIRMKETGIISERLRLETQRQYILSREGKRPHEETFASEEPRMFKLLVMRGVSEGIITVNKGRELLGDKFVCFWAA